MTQFHLFSQDSVRLETAPTGEVRKFSIKILVKFPGVDRGFEKGKQLTSRLQYRQKYPQC